METLEGIILVEACAQFIRGTPGRVHPVNGVATSQPSTSPDPRQPARDVGDAVGDATALPLELLAPLYVQYRLSWSSFFNILQQRVPPGANREDLADKLLGRFPELGQEAEFRRWVGSDRPIVNDARPAAPLTALTRAFGAPVPPDLENAALDRMAHVIERFAQTFLELRRGQRQFVADLSIPSGDSDPLAKLEDAPSLIRYLLDINAPPGRVDELSRAYADLMMHQVALVNGILAGAREVLSALSPETLTVNAGKGPVGWVMRLFGRDARWSALQRAVEDLQEDKALSSVVLGRMFARAYAAAMGQTSAFAAEPPSRERTGPL